MEMEKFNNMLKNDIIRNSSQKFLGVLRGAFEGFGCPKRHPDALLAKTLGTISHRCCSHCKAPRVKPVNPFNAPEGYFHPK